MAVLGNIRQKSSLVIIVIATALLLFVLSSLFESGGFSRTSNNVGTINGKDIAFQDFRITVDNVQKGMGPNGSSVNAANYVWNEEIKRVLIGEQYEKLGLRIGKDMILKTMKSDPSIGQNQMFLNDAGQFDIAKFQEYITSIKTTNPDQWNAWKKYEEQVEKMALENMYFELVRSGIGTTTAEAKTRYKSENDKVSFEYVSYPYASIKDEDVKVSTKEIEDYINKHQTKYKTEASRDIQFVFIPEKPSQADIDEVNAKMSGVINGKQEFDTNTNTTKTIPAFKDVINNEEFVNANSDIRYDSTFVSKDEIKTPANADKIYNLAVNEVYGPFEENGYSYIVKMLAKKPAAKVRASHILIAYTGAERANPKVTRTKQEAAAFANELLVKATADKNLFPALAMANSDDSSANNGGDLGFFSKGMMVKPFNDFVFANPVDKIGLVETDFGYHIIKVTEKQEGVRIATIGLKIDVSETTSDKLYADISNFEMKANAGDFTAIAKEMKYEIQDAKNLKSLDESIPTVGTNREIVKWSFDENTDKGALKKFNVSGGYVVAKLTAIKEAGILAATDAEQSVKPILIKQKKAALAKSKMIGKFDVVSKIAGVISGIAPNLSLSSPFIPNAGRELKVVAIASKTAVGAESGVIEGENGCYIIKTTEVTKAVDLPDYSAYVTKEKSKRNNITYQLLEAFKKKADITDSRYLFY